MSESEVDWKQRALDAEQQMAVAMTDANVWRQRAEAAEAELALHKSKPCDDDCGQCAECILLSVQTELQRQVERAETAEKERDSLSDCIKSLGGKLEYLQSVAAMSDAIQAKARVIEAENVEMKKACAEMREAIEMLRDFWEDYPKDRAVALNAMASTAGTGYLSPAEVKEKVKPMVDALRFCQENEDHWSIVDKALTHARKEGLL